MHKWHNASETEPARFIAITLAVEPFEMPGKGEVVVEEHVAGSEGKEWDVSML
jgi:hypothetical protein